MNKATGRNEPASLSPGNAAGLSSTAGTSTQFNVGKGTNYFGSDKIRRYLGLTPEVVRFN